MKVPSYLKKGDKIALISTARKIDEGRLMPGIELLRNRGLKVIIGKSIGSEDHQYAGNDALRSEDFQHQLDDPDVKAILCARGGYGSMRILDSIDFEKFRSNPKWICGFSDATTIHIHLQQVLQIASIHSNMPGLFPESPEGHSSTETLCGALFGEDLIYTYKHQHFYKAGNCEGIVVGGNLSLIYALQGSVSDLDTSGKILFIEDLDEYLYHIDRMMLSLDRAGKLKKLKGLIVGGMTSMKDNAVPFGKNAEEIIWEYASKYNYPVCFDFPAGHIDDNRSIRLGTRATLEIDDAGIRFIQKA